MSSPTSTPQSSGLATVLFSILLSVVTVAAVIALTSGLNLLLVAILCLVAVAVSIAMVVSLSARPSSAATVVLGTLAAFASFAVFAALLQNFGGGSAAVRSNSDERVAVKDKVLAEQATVLEKFGLNGDSSEVFKKSLAQLQTRKPSVTTQTVPGSPTALKAAAAAPAPAPAPAAPAPAAPTAPK